MVICCAVRKEFFFWYFKSFPLSDIKDHVSHKMIITLCGTHSNFINCLWMNKSEDILLQHVEKQLEDSAHLVWDIILKLSSLLDYIKPSEILHLCGWNSTSGRQHVYFLAVKKWETTWSKLFLEKSKPTWGSFIWWAEK